MTDESPRRHIPPEERAPWREFYYDPVVLGKFLLLYFFKSTILNYSSTIYYFTFTRSRIEVFLNLKSIEGRISRNERREIVYLSHRVQLELLNSRKGEYRSQDFRLKNKKSPLRGD